MDPRREVLEAARTRAAALAAGDASRLGELLHDDFRWTAHTGERFDRASSVESNTRGRTTWRGQDLGDAEVLVVGDAAVLRTVVTDTVNRANGSEIYRMPMTQFWVRAGSGWRCLAGTPVRDRFREDARLRLRPARDFAAGRGDAGSCPGAAPVMGRVAGRGR